MGLQILNFKAYSSGSQPGFYDLVGGGLVVADGEAFRKPGDNGEERVWFAWLATNGMAKDGTDAWSDLVTWAEPALRHLQALVRPQVDRSHHPDLIQCDAPRSANSMQRPPIFKLPFLRKTTFRQCLRRLSLPAGTAGPMAQNFRIAPPPPGGRGRPGGGVCALEPKRSQNLKKSKKGREYADEKRSRRERGLKAKAIAIRF
jgi:hypothetical protein